MTDSQKLASAEAQKKLFNKLKYDLEDWREAILMANSVLKWEKKFYAGLLFGATSFLFVFIWYMDMSVLTQLSLLALMGVILDYAYPIVSKFIFKPENWTGVQEKAFEGICAEIGSVWMRLCSVYRCMFVDKEQKSTKYYITTVVILLSLAYVGAIIDNLFLTYMVALLVTLYPGLQKNGIVQLLHDNVCEFLSKYFKFLKQKVTDVKKTE